MFDAKLPIEQIDVDFDFSRALAQNETISDAEITVSPTGITAGAPTASTTAVKVRLSGGTKGATHTVACKITTSTGQVLQHEEKIEVA